MGCYPFPHRKRPFDLLWAAPVMPGCYGSENATSYWVTTNHRPTLIKLRNSGLEEHQAVFALDAGGLPPGFAGALTKISDAQISEVIENLQNAVEICIPFTLTSRPVGEQKIGNVTVRVMDANVHLPVIKSHPSPPFVSRLNGALLLWLGQVIIFTIPLLIFGTLAWLAGIFALLVGTLGLVFLWPVIPGREILKTMIVGGGLSLICFVGFVVIQSWPVIQSLLPAAGLWIATLWMGAVFRGVKFPNHFIPEHDRLAHIQ